MDKNAEGLIWIKLVIGKSGVAAAVHSSSRRSSLIPIVWTMRSYSCNPESTKLKRQKNQKHSQHPRISSTAEQSSKSLRSSSGMMSALIQSRAIFVSPFNSTIEDEEEESADVCVVCLERPPDLQLLPCRHDRFCRQCIVETICTWVRPEAPSCPLCRGAFHTMVLLD
jgi:hypothetical protein